MVVTYVVSSLLILVHLIKMTIYESDNLEEFYRSGVEVLELSLIHPHHVAKQQCDEKDWTFHLCVPQNQTSFCQRASFTQLLESRLFLVLNNLEDTFGWNGSTECPCHLLMLSPLARASDTSLQRLAVRIEGRKTMEL